ncbi:hypothetical protein H113_08214, partial [Trichophyton rubrum MR1459]
AGPRVDQGQLTTHTSRSGDTICWQTSHGLVAFSFLLLSSVSASSSPWVAAGGGGDALSFPSLPPCKRPSPAPNPCLSDTQHRSSGSKHHHSTRSPSVLCFRCFSCCCYSYFSSLGISRPVNLASLSVVRFGAFFSFLFLHSPFHFVSASCSCLSALCYDLHIRALLFFVCEPNKLTSGAVRPGKGGSVEKLTAEKKKKVISRTPPGPHEWEKGRRDHRFQPCAVPDTVRQCVRLPSALGRGKWIANAIALGPEVCMYGGCASVMYFRGRREQTIPRTREKRKLLADTQKTHTHIHTHGSSHLNLI